MNGEEATIDSHDGDTRVQCATRLDREQLFNLAVDPGMMLFELSKHIRHEVDMVVAQLMHRSIRGGKPTATLRAGYLELRYVDVITVPDE